MLSVWRLKLIATDLGFPISLRDAIAASSMGQIAGSFFFQIVGQLLARGAILARRGVPSSATVTMTIYERAAAAAVSLLMAVAGSWYVFGRVTVDLQQGGLSFLKIAAGLLLALAMGACLGWGRRALEAGGQNFDYVMLWQLSRNVAVSAAIQLLTMAAYVAAAHAIVPDVSILDLAAAAAVVMLAASLPISLAGWGVRELSAVLALGAVGVPSAGALLVAVLIGVVSLVVVGLLAATSLWSTVAVAPAVRLPSPTINYDDLLAWALPILAATAVMFQLFVPIGGGVLNANLADPLAILGGCVFILFFVLRERTWPQWRISWFNTHVIGMTLVLTFSLLHGAMVIGWTPWSLTNKFLGWFVLLGYGTTGALLARRGPEEFIILIRTVVGVIIAVTAIEIFLIILTRLGVAVPTQLLAQRIEGFSQNPNAFGFQLLLALCLALAANLSERVQIATLSILMIGIWYTASRSALVALPITLLFAIYMEAASMRRLIKAAAIAVAFVTIIQLLPSNDFGFKELLIAVAAPGNASDAERTTSIKGAITLFLQNPLFGSGLGVFVAAKIHELGRQLVIHSTPLWLLAEMGATGLVVFAAPVVRVLIAELKPERRITPPAQVLVLIIVAFAVTSLVHEILYQRIFWLIFGAAMATKWVKSSPGGVMPEIRSGGSA